MDSINDFTTDVSLHQDAASEWTSEFPYQNTTMNHHNNEFNFYPNHSFYCSSANGPNNLGRYISMILYTVVCVIGLFGNSLVI